MSSSIDTIRRLANLSGNYYISEDNKKLKTREDDSKAYSKGLTIDELEMYDVFPIAKIDTDNIHYVDPADVNYDSGKYILPVQSNQYTIKRSEITNPTGVHIVFICYNSAELYKLQPDRKDEFWCNSINSDYISHTHMNPLFDKYKGKYLWYYGKKKDSQAVAPALTVPSSTEHNLDCQYDGSKGGRPRRRATFRQRRLKHPAAKSRRATHRRTEAMGEWRGRGFFYWDYIKKLWNLQ